MKILSISLTLLFSTLLISSVSYAEWIFITKDVFDGRGRLVGSGKDKKIPEYGGFTEFYYDSESIRREEGFVVGYYLQQSKHTYEFSYLYLIKINCLNNKLTYIHADAYNKLWLKGKKYKDYEFSNEEWDLPEFGSNHHKVVLSMCKHKY